MAMRGRFGMTVLDPQTFAASTLADSEGLAKALRTLESCLAGPDNPLDLILQDLCSVPHLFEFMISALPSGRELVSKIMNTYPTDPMLAEASHTITILQRLSSYLFASPPHLFSVHTAHQIGQDKVYVEDAVPVLSLLCSADFSTILTLTLEDPEYNDEGFLGLPMRNKQKKSKCQNKDNSPAIDTTRFHKLGAKVPSGYADASKMACEILDDLKMILKFCLEQLLEPALAQHLKDVYISTGTDSDTVVGPIAPQETEVSEVIEPKPSVYPKIQPLKAALYFENTDELGEWRIIIGTNATKKLREYAKSDRKKCNIVLKKIRQLSKGHFSAENQKRLNGPSGVPIFEAKMQRDLRLVYQIDVSPDHDGKSERQVIKIYNICTHTQLNRFWESVGQHLVGKGKEYYRRCIYRNQPVQQGSDVYLPACFPPESLERDDKSISLVLSDEDKRELHSLLVLDKYITFSRAFYHSLIANEDVQHAFELHPHERRIVECDTTCYVLGRSGTGKTTTMVFKMLGIEHAWQMQVADGSVPRPRQIFVTKSSVLAEKVKEYFVKLLKSLTLAGYSLGELKTIRAQTTAPEMAIKGKLPQKFSLLEEKHFPLFVTFDKLVRMIAADVLHGTKLFVNTDEIEAEDSFVTYDLFARTYWPRFPHQLAKGLEPWLVFSEFMGVIKGSEKSLSCPNRFLDEATYCSLSARTNPTFAGQRERLYALFQVYCKLKREHCHHDVADRTHAILTALIGGTPLAGQRVSYLYVDEAQDNLLIDALLLRLICGNPEGLFWAGDTAQTISAGSSFRFDDLKAFLYRIEREHSSHLVRDRSVTEPSVFQLAINYRSHGGIVNCAHTVIERIMHFWPDAIDRLKPECGIVDGLKPIFFRGWDQDVAQCEQFLFGGPENRIEFGAHQCILVRDKKAEEKLRQKVGKMVRIMTLYDSKGLEFNDVLLYNFFEDSDVDLSRWSVLFIGTDGVVDGKNLAKIYAPSFARDEGRFAGVCHELKLLYVGITRARKNLWIFDKSEKCEPMRMIWSSRDQVQNCTPEMGVPHLAVRSSPAEWASSGHEMLQLGKYSHAMECFTNASLPCMVALCEAFRRQELAHAKIGVESRKAQQDAFLVAGDAILVATDALTTNDTPSGEDKLRYYRSAAECYVRAGNNHWQKAATVYLSAQEYDLAARRFRKAGLFDKTLEVLHCHSQEISSACAEELYNVCRLFYCGREVKRPHWPLFPSESLEEEEQFLKDYDLDVARVALLESHGRYMEAAELHLSENRPFDAIRDFLKEKGSCEATQKATKILLDGLWQRCSFAIPPIEVAANQDVAELLILAHKLNLDSVDPLDRHEISMFQAIAGEDLAGLGELSGEFIKGNRRAAALLALDHFFSQLPELASYKIHEMTSFLTTFLEYTRLLHSIIYYPNPLSADSIRRLFCIREESNTDYGLQLGSFLHSAVAGDPDGSLHSQDSVAPLSKNDVVPALRKCLAARLRDRVLEENEECRAAPLFSQCLTFIMTERCNFQAGCFQDHVKREELDSKRYNLQLGIHLQQINILQLMFSVNPYPLVPSRAMTLEWLTYLYEAFKPQSHVQGSVADFDLSSIPGAQEGMGVMKFWVREALYNLKPGRRDFLTTVLRLTSLLFTFDKPNALGCINRARFNRDARRQFKYPDGHYVIEDIIKIFDGTQYNCISAGLKFLSHVLKSSQAIDLSVLCDCLEDTIGKICISWRFSFGLPLDGLVLPRAWLSASDLFAKKGIWIMLTGATLNYVKDLLMHLRSDIPSAIYTVVGANLTPTLRNVFISRISRALCFLTYNVTNREVRQKVRSIFNALRPANASQRTHPMYRKYVETPENEYLKAVVGYDIDARVVIEDVVQLLHRQRDPLRTRPLQMPRIKDIHFTSPSQIPSLASAQLVVARSELRVDAPSFTPRGVPQTKPDEQEADVEGAEEIHEDPATDDPALINEHEPTSQEISAAMKILTAYRTYRERREELVRAFGRGVEARKNQLFCKCLKHVFSSNLGKSPQRNLYLWALPRLVVYVDKVVAIAQEFKDKTKQQLKEGKHERLEELGMEMNNANVLVNQARRLQERIEPNAITHLPLYHVKAMIKKAVLDVQELAHRLPNQTQEIEEDPDFAFAYNFVMFGKQQVPRPKRPNLNTEDLLELAYH